MRTLEPMTREEIESQPFRTGEYNDVTLITSCLGPDGFNLLLDKKDKSLTSAIANTGYWESWITAWHTRNVGDYHLYIDAGANCGYYSMLAAALGAQVIAYEPNPKYTQLIDISARINDYRIKIHECALADETGYVGLNFFGDLDGSATIVTTTESNLVVPMTTLDQLAVRDRLVVLKMDVEGAEEMVFDGAQQFLANNSVTIIMEYTPGAYSKNFWDKLSKWGAINLVDFNGDEQPISFERANKETDWITLVIRQWL